MNFKNILLVEDDRLFQFITQAMIEKREIANSVVCKSNGAEAISYLASCCPLSESGLLGQCVDLILLDLDMPVMNGFAFLEALQQGGQEALIQSKVVVLSSSSDASDKETAHNFGVKGYVEKPLTFEKMQAVLF